MCFVVDVRKLAIQQQDRRPDGIGLFAMSTVQKHYKMKQLYGACVVVVVVVDLEDAVLVYWKCFERLVN